MITQTRMGQQRIVLSTGYDDFSKDLNRYARSKVSDNELADDLTQSTFLKTWTYLKRGGEIKTMEAFLYHVLKALIIDEYRKRKAMSLDSLLEKGFEPRSDDRHRLEEIIDGKQAAALIEQLPALYKTVIRLRYLEDRSLNEIALETNQTKNTVTVQSYRGLEKLKVLYDIQVDSKQPGVTLPL